MSILTTIFFWGFIITIVGLLFYFLVRIGIVSKFRIKILEACYVWSKNNVPNAAHNVDKHAATWLFKKLPDVDGMTFSFKPLKLNKWCTDDVTYQKFIADAETRTYCLDNKII